MPLCLCAFSRVSVREFAYIKSSTQSERWLLAGNSAAKAVHKTFPTGKPQLKIFLERLRTLNANEEERRREQII